MNLLQYQNKTYMYGEKLMSIIPMIALVLF